MITVQVSKVSNVDCRYIFTTEGAETTNTATIDLSLSSYSGQVISNSNSLIVGVYNQNLEIASAPFEVSILEARGALNDAYVLVKSNNNTILGLKDAGKIVNTSSIILTNNIEIVVYGHGTFTLWLSKRRGYKTIFDPQSTSGVASFIGNTQV